MPEKEYLILLDFDTRKRHYHVSKAGKIIKFVVQIEVNTEGKWREILRYDCAHNFTHRDSYNLKGESRKKGLYLDYEDALTYADEDINENWQTYREKFLRGDFP